MPSGWHGSKDRPGPERGLCPPETDRQHAARKLLLWRHFRAKCVGLGIVIGRLSCCSATGGKTAVDRLLKGLFGGPSGKTIWRKSHRMMRCRGYNCGTRRNWAAGRSRPRALPGQDANRRMAVVMRPASCRRGTGVPPARKGHDRRRPLAVRVCHAGKRHEAAGGPPVDRRAGCRSQQPSSSRWVRLPSSSPSCVRRHGPRARSLRHLPGSRPVRARRRAPVCLPLPHPCRRDGLRRSPC